MLTVLLTKHWYMPVCATARVEMSRVPPLIEITSFTVSGIPLKYQVTSGVGIPDVPQVKLIDPPTSCSRSLVGCIVIRGEAMCVCVCMCVCVWGGGGDNNYSTTQH